MIFYRIRNYWPYWPFGQKSDIQSEKKRKEFPQLREFFYIDQQSVRRLLVSTDSGQVATEQTDTERSVNTKQNSANVGASAGHENDMISVYW